MTLISCQFCGALHKAHAWRVPSLTCDRCWLEIQAGMITEQDFSAANQAKINYLPKAWVIQ